MDKIPDTENTRRAIKTLKKYSSKPIEVRDIKELILPDSPKPVTYCGATDETEDSFIIWLSGKCPEETFVHEVIHQILHLEGFPAVLIDDYYLENTIPKKYHNLIDKLSGFLGSTFSHPEVFRRMETLYDFDLDNCYEMEFRQKMNRFKKSFSDETKDKNNLLFSDQQEILTGLDYYLWGESHKKTLTDIQLINFPSAYNACVDLYKRCSKIGFSTPSNMHKSAQLIKKTIIDYGENNHLNKDINNLWRALDIRRSA